ncbi:MAG: DNA methyltransferase, partial [Terrimicrobiaceae bacterium]
NFHNIECRDAVLAYDRTEPVLDENGAPVTRWDGRTVKKHPVTGEDVPDETARVPLLSYENPRPAEWPQADFIVGNPPFIGNKRMRDALGDAYTEALRQAHPDVAGSSDFVMYWWNQAARLVAKGKAGRFGLITTNSISMTSNRQVVATNLGEQGGVSLLFAIPDHPWVDSADGASVRIAMTVGVLGTSTGTLAEVIEETVDETGESAVRIVCRSGAIHGDLTVGAHVAGVERLQSNRGVCFQGVILVGEGFRLGKDDLSRLRIDVNNLPPVVRPHLSGKDVVQAHRGNFVIDLHGLNQADAVRDAYPELYQHLYDTVRPHRLENRDKQRRERWWLFGRSNDAMRSAIQGLRRFIVTVETSKHKPFVFVNAGVCPDHKLYVVASDDAWILGVLSSKVHQVWALAAGGTLEDRPTWTNTTCFLPFPFPTATEAQQTRIRDLAEALDAHRKRQQAQHPKLTLTDCYNVLEKLRAGTPLNAKEQLTHEQGLVTVLHQHHDDLDAAVAEAYALPVAASDEAILTHLCALNARRAAEERAGTIRYLRPAFQNPASAGTQATLATDGAEETTVPAPAKASDKLPWPKSLAEQARAVRAALAAPTDAATLAKTFKGANADRVEEILETLASLGHARALPAGKFVAA